MTTHRLTRMVRSPRLPTLYHGVCAGLGAPLALIAATQAHEEHLAPVQQDLPSFRLQVDISGQSVSNFALAEVIHRALARTGVDGSGLDQEITETAAIPDLPRARAFMAALRTDGVRFALDDFGTGFGSLAYLKHLRFDYLKIDGEFVVDCVADSADRLVVDTATATAIASSP